MSDTFTPLTDVVERLQKVDHVMYTTGWRSNSLASDAAREVTRLRTLLSEAEQRGKDSVDKAQAWDVAQASYRKGYNAALEKVAKVAVKMQEDALTHAAREHAGHFEEAIMALQSKEKL